MSQKNTTEEYKIEEAKLKHRAALRKELSDIKERHNRGGPEMDTRAVTGILKLLEKVIDEL